jgi:polar amino acid transport system permease protein
MAHVEVSRPNPQKTNILIQKLSRAPWWVLIIIALVMAFYLHVQDSRTYNQAWNEVQKGIGITIQVTVIAYSMALVIGLILALLRRPSKSVLYNLFIYQPVTAFVEIFRGIPTLVLVLAMSLSIIPESIKLLNMLGDWLITQDILLNGYSEQMAKVIPRDFPTIHRAIIALAVSYAAFLAEVFRAGLDSIEIGQHEASQSLGMSRWQTLRFIILPQAIRNILPALGNDFIAMLKESSLVSVVGVMDITRAGQSFAAATFTFFPSYNVIAVTYLVMTLILSIIVKLIEWFLSRGHRNG